MTFKTRQPSPAALLLLLALAALSLSSCYASIHGDSIAKLSDNHPAHRHRSLNQACQWNCDYCNNCKQSQDGVCRLYGSKNSTCRIMYDCIFGRQVFRANDTLTPPTDWTCTPPGKTSGVCMGCVAALDKSPKASPVEKSPKASPKRSPPPPSPPTPPSPAPPSPQSSGGNACHWTCDECTNCKRSSDGTCRLFGAKGTKCSMVQDCLFGPLMFKAGQSLAPPEAWSCIPAGGVSSQCTCP